MKASGLALIAIGVLILIIVGSYYGGILGNQVQANYNKRTVTNKVQQHVRTPAFAQAVYEGFFNTCAQVQTTEATLDAQYEELAATTNSDDKVRILANIAGNKSARADYINQYNADAAEYTRGQFLASNLPARLSNEPYQKGNRTTCAQ